MLMQSADRGSKTQPPASSRTSSVPHQVLADRPTASANSPQTSGRHHITASTPTSASLHVTEPSCSSPAKPQRTRHQCLRPDRAYDDTPPVSIVSSSLQAPSLFDMPRSKNASPMMSPNSSRRPSILIQKDGDDKIESRDREGETNDPLSASKLRQSLMELDAFSNDATRTLNDTCDAMQEHTAALEDIVIALKELAETTRDIRIDFERVSHELESDITNQLDSMGQFKGQQKAIELLQNRIQKGRRRIEALTARVDVVLLRVEGWEQAANLWQERTRKRLTIIWTVLSVLALVLVVLFVFVDYGHDVASTHDDVEIRSENQSHLIPELQHDLDTCMVPQAQTLIKNEMDAMAESVAEDKNDTRTERKTPADDGEWLRALDEL